MDECKSGNQNISCRSIHLRSLYVADDLTVTISPTKITNRKRMTPELHKIVNDLIKSHGGGEEFFNELDSKVATDEYFSQLYDLVEKHAYNNNKPLNFISTGNFGRAFNDWLRKIKSDQNHISVWVAGGLRQPGSSVSLRHTMFKVIGREFYFVDDSYFSGSTLDKIEKELNNYKGSIIKAFVVYDGSVDKSVWIDSLCRYYDMLVEML